MRKAALAVAVMLLLISCGSMSRDDHAGYVAASQVYQDDADIYKVSFDHIKLLRSSTDKVSLSAWNEFVALVDAVNATNRQVWADLEQWRTTGQEPATFESRLKALKDAQDAVINLDRRVSQ